MPILPESAMAAAALSSRRKCKAWHPRLLNGSDYPLPGVMPLFAPAEFARAGMLAEEHVPMLGELHAHNPLLFDFVLKRQLSINGRRLSPRIFETRPFFESAVA